MAGARFVSKEEFEAIKKMLVLGVPGKEIAKFAKRSDATISRINTVDTYDGYVKKTSAKNHKASVKPMPEEPSVEEVTPLYEVRESTIRRIADALDHTNEMLEKLLKAWG